MASTGHPREIARLDAMSAAMPVPLAEPQRAKLLGPTLVALLICSASISRFPGIDDYAFVKVGITIAEFGVLGAMYQLRDRSVAIGRWFAFGVAFVILRFFYGWLIANLQYGVGIGESFQEGRFGIMIMIAPIGYAFYRRADILTLNRMILAYLAAVIVCDIAVYLLFVTTGQLLLAQRGGDRYVLSVLAPLTFIWIKMVINNRNGKAPDFSDAGAFVLILLHIFLFTTSRIEAIFSSAVLSQWLYIRYPTLRAVIIGGAIASVVGLLYFQNLRGGEVAGRDYNLAFYYTRAAFPFGAGLISQSIQNSQLSTDSTFLVSDYGLLVLLYHYGIVGLVMALGLLGYWISFSVKTLTIPGNFFFAAAVLFYLGIVPILDYGSMNGGLVLGAMAAVAGAVGAARAVAPVSAAAVVRN